MQTVDLEREYLQEMIDLFQTRVSTELNRFVRKVTAWGTVAIAWTVITGIYGMNVIGIPGVDSPWGFPPSPCQWSSSAACWLCSSGGTAGCENDGADGQVAPVPRRGRRLPPAVVEQGAGQAGIRDELRPPAGAAGLLAILVVTRPCRAGPRLGGRLRVERAAPFLRREERVMTPIGMIVGAGGSPAFGAG